MVKGKGWREVQKATLLLRQTLSEAKQSLESRQPERARQLFEQCVQINEQSKVATQQDILASRIGLGDSYFALKDYAAAETSYKVCLDMLDQNTAEIELLVTILVKRARALEWLKQVDQADQLLKSASALAQDRLAPGHLLISSTLEARAALLRKHHHAERLADQLEEAARANLSTRTGSEQGDYTEKILQGLAPDQYSDRESTGSADDRPKKGRRRFLRRAQEKEHTPVRTLITRCLAVTVVAGLFGTGMTFLFADWFETRREAVERAKREEIKAEDQLIGKEFKTADNIELIKFLKNNNAEIRFDDLSRPVKYRWSRRSNDKSEPSKLLLNQLDQSSLSDESGNILYEEAAPERRLIKQANFLSETLSNYYQINNRYPLSEDDLKVFEPRVLFANPYSGKVAAPSVTICADEKLFQERLQEARAGKPWDKCPTSCLEVQILSGTEEDQAFVIRIRDRCDKFVTSSVPAKAFFLYGHNGDTTSLQGIIKAEVDRRKDQISVLRDTVVVVLAPPETD